MAAAEIGQLKPVKESIFNTTTHENEVQMPEEFNKLQSWRQHLNGQNDRLLGSRLHQSRNEQRHWKNNSS